MMSYALNLKIGAGKAPIVSQKKMGGSGRGDVWWGEMDLTKTRIAASEASYRFFLVSPVVRDSRNIFIPICLDGNDLQKRDEIFSNFSCNT